MCHNELKIKVSVTNELKIKVRAITSQTSKCHKELNIKVNAIMA